jgi:cation diffusion facilitator family transporter
MKFITQWIVKKWIPKHDDINNVEVRARYGAIEAWLSIFLNSVLFIIKGIMGILLHSVSLIADAIHTLSDTGTSIVLLFGFKIAKRPSDREHPFGHGRMEAIATLVIAVLLIVAGVELLRSSVSRIFHPTVSNTQLGWLPVIILIGTIVLKEAMARFAYELGKMIKSDALRADAWHHRTDALSTILVVVALVLARFGYIYVDGVVGVLVALIITYSGYAIARDAINPLLGEEPSRQLLKDIENIAKSVKGVLGVHDVIVHRYGQVNHVSLHIEVCDSRPIGELHDLSEDVERIIEKNISGSAVVHIDPVNKNHVRYDEIHSTISSEISQDSRISGFHDLRIVGHGLKVKAIFDITLDKDVKDADVQEIKQQLRDSLGKKLTAVRFIIKAEPKFAYSS